MVGAFGKVHVMDWGLAKVLSADRPGNGPGSQQADTWAGVVQTVWTRAPGAGSRAGSVLGTPAYMAPEQARGEGERIDERCDVFGLGGILCEILTGQPPYLGQTGTEVYRQAEQADLTDARTRLGACGADEGLRRLAERCLAPKPEDRPRDAGVVAQELTAYLASVEQRRRAAELERAAAEVRAREERKRRRLTVALAAAVLLVVTAGGGGWLVRAREARQTETARAVSVVLGKAEQLWE